MTVRGEEVPYPVGGEISAFEPLDDTVAAQSVPIGTPLSELVLPKTLAVTVSGAAVSVPVIWDTQPEYKPGGEDEEPGEYLFTPQLGEDYTLAEGVSAPTITVTTTAMMARGAGEPITWDTFSEFETEDLSKVKRSNTNYKNIMALELPEFSEVRNQVKEENQSVFDWLFEGFAIVIDSDFVASSVDLKKVAEQKTNETYDAFLNEIAKTNLLKEDAELGSLIEDMAVAKDNLEYKDALSKAINYLAKPQGKYAETYSRVFYAFLADGLVLLIGYSLRRKKTAIYQMNNRQDLKNQEPQLIKEALYNMASQDTPKSNYETCTVENLIYHLNDFISCFEIESYMNDDSLNMSFSLVCKEEDLLDKLNSDYKEMIYTLQALKYIKPISKEQYDFYTRYKKNKAVLEGENIKNQIDNLSDNCKEHYYLMTTGFALYCSELLNTFFEYVENEQIRKKLKREFEEVSKDELL